MPNFSCKAVVFSENRIDLAEVQHGGIKPAVLRYESYPLDTGPVSVLKRLKVGKRLEGACTVLLRHGQYQLLQVDEPGVPPEELKQALRWQIKEMVDFPVEAAGIDLLRIPVGGTGGSRSQQLFVVAASHAVLTPCIQMFQEAKVNLTAIDIPELAQRNVAALYEEPNRALAMLAFDADGGRLTFTSGGELYAVRRIEVGTGEFAGANEERSAVLFERVLLDVQRSLDNFDRNFSYLPLSRLLVLPPVDSHGFVEYLRSNLFQPLQILSPEFGFDLSEVPNLMSPAAFAEALPAIGAALRYEASN